MSDASQGILEKESHKISNQIALLARKIAIMAIGKIIDDETTLSKNTDVDKLIDEALKGGSNVEEQCLSILVSGKNKGGQCSLKKMKSSDYCSRHAKMMEVNKTDKGKRKKKLETVVLGDDDEEDVSFEHLGGDLYLLDDSVAKIVLIKKDDEYIAAALLSEGSGGTKKLGLLSSKAKILCGSKRVKHQSSLFKEANEAYKSLNEMTE